VDDVRKIIAGLGMTPTDTAVVEEFYRHSIAMQKLDESKSKLEEDSRGLREMFEIFETTPLKENRASRRREKFGKNRK